MSQFRDGAGNLIVKVGDFISWSTVGGVFYEGTIIEIDSNVAVVRLVTGENVAVEL